MSEVERVPDPRYRGMNPKFVNAVWQKRRQQKAQQSLIERQRAKDAPNRRQVLAATREREWEEAAKEESFRAEFLDAIAHLRIQFMVEKYKVVSIASRMEARYRAAEILQHHVDRSPYTLQEFKSACRTRDLVKYRQAAMADIYVLCPHLSLPQIGKIFGGRDHTTVLHAIQKLGVHKPVRERQAA